MALHWLAEDTAGLWLWDWPSAQLNVEASNAPGSGNGGNLLFFEMVASVALIMINCKHAVHGATFCLRSDRQTHRNGHAHIPVTLANRETAFGCYPAAAPKKVCFVLQQTVWPSYASGSWNFSRHFLTTTLSRGPFFCTHLREWEYGSGGGDSRKPKTRSRRQERKMRKDMEKQRNK